MLATAISFDEWMLEVRELISDMTTIRFDAEHNIHWHAFYLLGISPLTAVTQMCKHYRRTHERATGFFIGRDDDTLPLRRFDTATPRSEAQGATNDDRQAVAVKPSQNDEDDTQQLVEHDMSEQPLCKFGPGGDYVRDYEADAGNAIVGFAAMLWVFAGGVLLGLMF